MLFDNLKRVRKISPYLKYLKDSNSYVFTGKQMDIYVSSRYQKYGLQDISDKVNTLAVGMATINDSEYANLGILSNIEIHPSDVDKETIYGVDYTKIVLKTGDTFINSCEVVKNPNVIYCIWIEFINQGKPPPTFEYEDIAHVFDKSVPLAGTDIGVDPVLYEVVVSHLCRSLRNKYIQFRYTDGKGPMAIVPLRSVPLAPESTQGRIIGSYSDHGIVSAINHPSKSHHIFEDILRGIPVNPQE